MQQQAFGTENLTNYFQCLTKPLMDMAKLNTDTFNHLTNNQICLEEFWQAKRPEDLISAQMQLASKIGAEASQYFQAAASIGMEACSTMGKQWFEGMTNATKQTQEQVKRAAKKGKL
jgi:hypothetical protein